MKIALIAQQNDQFPSNLFQIRPACLRDFLAPAPDHQPSAQLDPELLRFGWPCVRWRSPLQSDSGRGRFKD
jgi:hypothetical protein